VKASDLNPAEINALIAEKVMGWVLRRKNGYQSWHEEDSVGSVRKTLVYKWRPSTSIADAWKVVEKMREIGFILGTGETFGKPCMWFRDGYEDDCRYGYADGPSDPMNICLAALRAKGVIE